MTSARAEAERTTTAVEDRLDPAEGAYESRRTSAAVGRGSDESRLDVAYGGRPAVDEDRRLRAHGDRNGAPVQLAEDDVCGRDRLDDAAVDRQLARRGAGRAGQGEGRCERHQRDQQPHRLIVEWGR